MMGPLGYISCNGTEVDIGEPDTVGRRVSVGRRWGIVGGGMLGLTLAHRFAQAGDTVTVFDTE